MLAEQLGYASPTQMLNDMTGVELRDWLALYELRAERERDAALDAKGKASLRALIARSR